jgi:hypothetical protein
MDMYCEWGQDIQVDQNGNIIPATGWDEARQHIQRILLTTCQETFLDGTSTAPENLFAPNFGLSFRAMVATEFDQQTLNTAKQKIAAAVAQEPSVNPSVPPVVTVTNPTQDEILVSVVVTLVNNQQAQFDVSLP